MLVADFPLNTRGRLSIQHSQPTFSTHRLRPIFCSTLAAHISRSTLAADFFAQYSQLTFPLNAHLHFWLKTQPHSVPQSSHPLISDPLLTDPALVLVNVNLLLGLVPICHLALALGLVLADLTSGTHYPLTPQHPRL